MSRRKLSRKEDSEDVEPMEAEDSHLPRFVMDYRTLPESSQHLHVRYVYTLKYLAIFRISQSDVKVCYGVPHDS